MWFCNEILSNITKLNRESQDKKNSKNNEKGYRKHLRHSLRADLNRMFATHGFFPKFKKANKDYCDQLVRLAKAWVNNDEHHLSVGRGIIAKMRRKTGAIDKCFSSYMEKLATDANILYGPNSRDVVEVSIWLPFLVLFNLVLYENSDKDRLSSNPLLKGGVTNSKCPGARNTGTDKKDKQGKTKQVSAEKLRSNVYLNPATGGSQGGKGFKVLTDTQVEFTNLTARIGTKEATVISSPVFAAFMFFKITCSESNKPYRYREELPRLEVTLKRDVAENKDIFSVSYDEGLESDDGETIEETAVAQVAKKIRINAIDVTPKLIELAWQCYDLKSAINNYRPAAADKNANEFKTNMFDSHNSIQKLTCELASIAKLRETTTVETIIINNAIQQLSNQSNITRQDIITYVKAVTLIEQIPRVKLRDPFKRDDLKELVTAFGVRYHNNMHHALQEDPEIVTDVSLAEKMVVVAFKNDDATGLLDVVRGVDWRKEDIDHDNLFEGQSLWMGEGTFWTSNIEFMQKRNYDDDRYHEIKYIIWLDETMMEQLEGVLKLSPTYY